MADLITAVWTGDEGETVSVGPNRVPIVLTAILDALNNGETVRYLRLTPVYEEMTAACSLRSRARAIWN